MTAVSRLMLIVCVTGATTLAAQTSQPTNPTTAASSPQLQRVTAPVTADTDRDASDPRALKLSLDDAIRTSIRQNLGVELERYSFRESIQDLRGSYGIFDIFTSA